MAKNRTRNKKKSAIDHNIIAKLLNNLGQEKKFQELIDALKCYKTKTVRSSTINSLLKINPKVISKIYGCTMPKNILEIASMKTYFYKPKSLINEIDWVILSIKLHKKEITYFVKQRKAFEHLALIGEYDKALSLLNDIEKTVGISIWLFEARFVIYEFMRAQDQSTRLMSNLNKQRKTLAKDKENGFPTFLLYFLWERSKKDLSAIKYDLDLYNRFKRNRTEFQNDYYNYNLFRLNYYQHYDIEDIAIPLIMESTNSIIDRYIILIDVLKSACIKEFTPLYSSRSEQLYSYVNDERLLPIIFLHTHKYELYPNYYNSSYIEILNMYYCGDYKGAIHLCQNYIKNDTSNFDVLVIYCYCLLYRGNGYSPIISLSGSVINEICRKIYDSFNQSDNTSVLYNLYQINKNIYSFEIANGLDFFIKKENNNIRSDKLKLMSLKCFDPLFVNGFETINEKLQYLDLGLSTFHNAPSIERYKRRVKKIVSINNVISPNIAEKDNAFIFYENDEYTKSYSAWLDILEKSRNKNPALQTAIKYAFSCLVEQNKYQDAIKFYVDEYIKNPIGIKKANVEGLLHILKKNRYNGIKRIIELPIFIGLNSKKDTDKSFVLQSFCQYYDVKKPSELIDILSDDIVKQETLFYVCITEDILRHYVYINSTQDILEEKLLILNHLISLKTDNEDLYNKIKDEVLDELVIYRGTKKIDESKIYANDQAIIKYELKDIDGLYNRFRAQYELLNTKEGFLIIDINNCNTNISSSPYSKTALLKTNIAYTDNALYNVAYALYDTVRDKFLFSKFGLATYLSTRIRHGVLEGELRSAFVERNIILNKYNDEYVNSTYWSSIYGLDEYDHKQLGAILEKFSKTIDSIISSFKSDILQITILKDGMGAFNYYISDEDLTIKLLIIASKAKDSKDYIDSVIKDLWEITSKNLDNIRKHIKTNLLSQFHEAFNTIIQEIDNNSFSHLKSDLLNEINSVRAEIGGKLQKIEGWFHIQEVKFEDFKLIEHINISWESTKKFYPHINCDCDFKLTGTDVTIKATYGLHFSDLLRIFLTNMFKYSAKSSGNIHCNINIKIENDNVFMIFENEIDTDEKNLNDKIWGIMNNENFLQKEGGSGLVKAKKIIRYDLENKNNTIKIKAIDHKFTAKISINLENLKV